MSRSSYTPRHSGAAGSPGSPGEWPKQEVHPRSAQRRLRLRSRLCGCAAGLTVIAVTAAVALMHAGIDPADDAALSSASCAAAPSLAADTSTNTLLGVNATNLGQLSTDTSEFGHISALRVYYVGLPETNLWTTGVQGANHSAVVVSFVAPPATVLSGADDKALASFFDSAPTGYPIYYAYYQEPEIQVGEGDFTTAQYRAAWAHVAAIADAAHNPYLKSTLILMSYDLDPSSGVNWKDYLPSGNVISVMGWDAYPAGTVHDSNPQPTPPADFMGPAEAAARSVGLPFGFAEFALGTETDRPQWLTEVASYLRSTGALFGTLFDSTGFPWMYLKDSPSIQAWRAAIAGSPSTPAPSAPPPSRAPVPPSSPVSASPTASISSSGSPSASASPIPGAVSEAPNPQAPAPPAVTGLRVDPEAFAPNQENHVRVLFKLSQPANVAICVLNSQGAVLRELDRPDLSAGWSSTWYFGHGGSGGALLPVGNYRIIVVATNTAGLRSAVTQLTITSS